MPVPMSFSLFLPLSFFSRLHSSLLHNGVDFCAFVAPFFDHCAFDRQWAGLLFSPARQIAVGHFGDQGTQGGYALGATRTPSLGLRTAPLYPVELRAHLQSHPTRKRIATREIPNQTAVSNRCDTSDFILFTCRPRSPWHQVFKSRKSVSSFRQLLNYQRKGANRCFPLTAFHARQRPRIVE